MSEEIPQPGATDFSPPVSSFSGPIAELIAHRMLSPPGRLGMLATLDRFEILRIVGSGGMGIVLLARDTANENEVAIKLIRPELAADPTTTHRFIKEASHMQRLKHKGIAAVLEVSRVQESPYFVMPYFNHGNLARAIRPGTSLESDFILEIALQIADGLQFAHQSGIIHRDLKPANILLTAEGLACLSDFGLARTMFNDTFVDVENLQIEGTAPYMSPAIAKGQAEDTRCDIYSFGALLYEMLTGEPPYTGRTTREIRSKIIAGPPAPIKSLSPQADPGLVFIAESAMGRELRDRYANMADVVADLLRIKERKTPLGARGLSRGTNETATRSSGLAKLFWAFAALATLLAIGGGFIYRFHLKPMALLSKKEVLSPIETHRSPGPLSFERPCGLAVDQAGNLYLADNALYTISKVSPTGRVTTLAGRRGIPGNTDGGSGGALFSLLRGVAVAADGDLLITDAYRIRKLSPTGVVNTLAGMTGSEGSNDGSKLLARFDRPSGLSVGNDGNVYVADTYTVRRVTPQGMVKTLAGASGHSGDADGLASLARFSDQNKGLVVDGTGNLFLADSLNCTIRKISPDGLVSTIAGSSRRAGSSDGPGKTARFFRPGGVAINRLGEIYIADTFNHTIRKLTPSGNVTTFAGLAGQAGTTDGTGNLARFNFPQALVADGAGNIFVADTGNHRVRKISPAGVVSTLLGPP